MHKDTTFSSEMAELGRRLREFREAHVPRTRLPEELWPAAASVARQEGLYRTARSLRLDYAQLKRRVAPSSSSGERRSARKKNARRKQRAALPKRAERTKRSSAATAFVELLSDSLAADCLIEVEGASGGRMRIRRKMSTAEVLNLVRHWREGHG